MIEIGLEIEKKALTPGSSRCVLNFTDKIPSGTSKSPSSVEIPKVVTTFCFSFRLSELRRGADVLSPLNGFLNIEVVVDRCKLAETNEIQIRSVAVLCGRAAAPLTYRLALTCDAATKYWSTCIYISRWQLLS